MRPLEARALRRHCSPSLSSLSHHLCAFLQMFPYLRQSQAVQVGDVEHSAHSSGVHTTGPSLLQTQVVQDCIEAGILGVGGEELFYFQSTLITILLNVKVLLDLHSDLLSSQPPTFN